MCILHTMIPLLLHSKPAFLQKLGTCARLSTPDRAAMVNFVFKDTWEVLSYLFTASWKLLVHLQEIPGTQSSQTEF